MYYDNGGQYWNPWWVGILNHEAIEYETKDRPYLVTLKASCGLRRLNNIEFTHNGGPWLTTTSLANCVAKCINSIPTADFWSPSTTQFSEVVDLFNEGHAVNTAQWSPTPRVMFTARSPSNGRGEYRGVLRKEGTKGGRFWTARPLPVELQFMR